MLRGLERCPACCSFPCLNQKSSLGEKCKHVHNSQECRFLLPLLEVGQHLVFTISPHPSTLTLVSLPLSCSLSQFLELNAEQQTEERKGIPFDSQLQGPSKAPGLSVLSPTDPEVWHRHRVWPSLILCLSFSHPGNRETTALVSEITLVAFG